MLSAATFPGALKIIKYTFIQDEAVSIGCEVNNDPVAAEELLELCADAALDGVSLVAIATDTDDVVAVSFNKLQVATSSSSEKTFFEIFAEERCKQEASRATVEFMTSVDGRCNLFQKYGIDCSLEIMYMATHRDHRRRRLGELLTKYTIEVARQLKNGPVSEITIQDLGPKYSYMKPRVVSKLHPKICQAIFTSEATQRIAKKLHFTVHLTVFFDDIVYNGKTYAERIGPESPFCELVAILLY